MNYKQFDNNTNSFLGLLNIDKYNELDRPLNSDKNHNEFSFFPQSDECYLQPEGKYEKIENLENLRTSESSFSHLQQLKLESTQDAIPVKVFKCNNDDKNKFFKMLNIVREFLTKVKKINIDVYLENYKNINQSQLIDIIKTMNVRILLYYLNKSDEIEFITPLNFEEIGDKNYKYTVCILADKTPQTTYYNLIVSKIPSIQKSISISLNDEEINKRGQFHSFLFDKNNQRNNYENSKKVEQQKKENNNPLVTNSTIKNSQLSQQITRHSQCATIENNLEKLTLLISRKECEIEILFNRISEIENFYKEKIENIEILYEEKVKNLDKLNELIKRKQRLLQYNRRL